MTRWRSRARGHVVSYRERRGRNRWSSNALEVGDEAAAGLNQLVRLDTKHVVPCARSGPHLGVLQQIGIDAHTQLVGMTNGGTSSLVERTC